MKKIITFSICWIIGTIINPSISFGVDETPQYPPQVPLFIFTVPETLLLAEASFDLTGGDLDSLLDLINLIPELIGTTILEDNHTDATLDIQSDHLTVYHPAIDEIDWNRGLLFYIRQILDGTLTDIAIVQVIPVP